jgi:hypothetical protein
MPENGVDLPSSSISSLKEFHVAFHSYYKGIFSVEFLYEECCEEFELFTSLSQ